MLTDTIEVKMTMCDIKQWWNQVEKYRETGLTGEILQMNVISVQKNEMKYREEVSPDSNQQEQRPKQRKTKLTGLENMQGMYLRH